MGKGNSRNRHGIPLRGGDPPRPHTCIWPACMDEVGQDRETRMCNQHATQVYEVVQARRQRIRVVIDGTPKPPPPAPARPREEMIYYVEYADEIKIGWTTDLERRLKSFKPGGKLLAAHSGTRGEEARLHKRFKAYGTHGKEWYAKMPSLLHHIELVKKEHGEPPALTVGPEPVGIPEPREKVYVAGKRIIKPGRTLYGKFR